MNKISIVFGIVLILFIYNINAQETKHNFGIKAGLNYSNFIGGSGYNGNFNGRIGYNIGGFFNLKLSEKVNLKPELLFSKRGAEYVMSLENFVLHDYDPVITSTNYTANIKEYLILLPIMIDYYLTESFNFELGPQIAYVISQDVSDNNENISFKGGKFDKFEAGLNLGIGYNFAEKYRIGFRYNYGITERDGYNSSVFQLDLNFKI
jgi:hypothetical protein